MDHEIYLMFKTVRCESINKHFSFNSIEIPFTGVSS